MSKLEHWKDKIIEVKIDGFSHEGKGICRIEKLAVFIEGAIPGEVVEAKIIETKKNYLIAELIEVLQPTESRIEPPCPVFKTCGGCQLQHMEYEKQLEIKTQMVKDIITRIGKLPEVKVLPTIGMTHPWNYRNKGHFQVENKKGRVTLGFYVLGSHELVDAKSCLIFSPIVKEIIKHLEDILNEFKIEVFDRKKKQGYLRNIMIRESRETKEILIVFVTNSTEKENLEEISIKLKEKYPQIVSLWQNINTTSNSLMLGEESRLINGLEFIEDTIGAYKFQISPQSFFQVNPIQTEILYSKANDYARLTGREIVLDAYCGIGTIGSYMSKNAKKIFGIEVVKEAIEDAKQNAVLNNVNNTEFLVGKVEVELPKLVKRGFKPDAVVLDPPRKGCDPRTLESILEVKPKRVVYVSCDPGTLARDLRILADGGYEVQEVQPVDMFPQTRHVETVVLLHRKHIQDVE